jgi:hypothetical protein
MRKPSAWVVPRTFGVEGSFFGETADECENLFADFALAGFDLSASGDGGDGGAAGGGFFGGDGVEVVGEFGAADAVGAVGVGANGSRRRCWGRRLGGKERSNNESGGWKEMEGSHRAALIHRGGGGVNRWSYQFRVSCVRA